MGRNFYALIIVIIIY